MRQGYGDAVGYFTNLINILNKQDQAVPSLLPEAYYALADTYIVFPQAVPGATNVLDGYRAALEALGKITQVYPTNALAPLAWGHMGECYFQLTNYAKNYERAAEAYTNALTNELADVMCRSIAEVGLGGVLERQAAEASPSSRTNLLNEAMQHYLYVVYGKNLRDREKGDPLWVKEAAVAAARLAEEQHRWDVAAELYERLRDELAPPLRKTWEAKLDKLRQLRASIESPPN
jgi:tetratricopeptide (TPR) repeat protein